MKCIKCGKETYESTTMHCGMYEEWQKYSENGFYRG